MMPLQTLRVPKQDPDAQRSCYGNVINDDRSQGPPPQAFKLQRNVVQGSIRY